MRTVTINKVLNGIKVQVGCTELVFNHVEEFITAFREYAANPEKVEKEWLTRFGAPMGPPTPVKFDNAVEAAIRYSEQCNSIAGGGAAYTGDSQGIGQLGLRVSS